MKVLKISAFVAAVIFVGFMFGVPCAVLAVVTFWLGLMLEHHLNRANISMFSRQPLSKARNSTWATPGPSMSALFVGVLAQGFLIIYVASNLGVNSLAVMLVASVLAPTIEYRSWLRGKSTYREIARRLGIDA